MLSRRVSVGVVALLLVGLTGCTGSPAPEPTPTPTGFASEEEAFAAAEETYRARVEGLNAYYAGDKSYDPAEYLSGEPLKDERELLEQMEELQLSVEGQLVIRTLERVSVDTVADSVAVRLITCLDSSGTRVLDASGNDVTPAREELLALDVELATVEDRLLIVESATNSEHQC